MVKLEAIFWGTYPFLTMHSYAWKQTVCGIESNVDTMWVQQRYLSIKKLSERGGRKGEIGRWREGKREERRRERMREKIGKKAGKRDGGKEGGKERKEGERDGGTEKGGRGKREQDRSSFLGEEVGATTPSCWVWEKVNEGMGLTIWNTPSLLNISWGLTWRQQN